MRADTIERRGDAPLHGAIMKIDDAGVELATETGTRHKISWDRIRDVKMDRPNSAMEKYKDDATNLWRARSRLERHDVDLAEPLFERLFETYRGKTHETALVVAEGLLRCRMSRSANETALIPALEVARIRRAGITTINYAKLPAIVDETTSLCPTLPPAWASSPALVKLERDLGSYDAKGDVVIAAQAVLYRQALANQLGIKQAEDDRNLAADHAGVKLLRTVVKLLSKDSSEREQARQAVSRDLSNMPNWSAAWSHYFIGLSRLGEEDTDSRDRGLVSLAHVPARYAADQPYLARLALARMAESCDASGQSEAAASLRSELTSWLPDAIAKSTKESQ